MLTAHHAEHPGPMPATLVMSAVSGREGRAAPREPGVIRLLAVPASPRAGQRVRLEVMAPRVGAHGYRWRLPGGAASPKSGAASPRSGADVYRLSASFAPGLHRVTVRMVAADRVYTGALILRVRAAADRASKVAMKMPGEARSRARGSVAHAANDPAVKIVDFHFSPATITVHEGETVTWVNDGSMPHSATARDGSFDTGILPPGHSASHTFTQAGSFSYFCSVHPFMHGTIVVLANASTTPAKPASTPAPTASTNDHAQPPASSPAGSSAGQPATSAPSSSASTLPVTGMNLIGALACGALLLGSGIGLRRGLARRTP